MLVVHQVDFSIGTESIIENIGFEIESGTLCVIVGQNGSGKSTLLRCLSGWNVPTKGEITIDNRQLQKI